jgi:formimidoylglutamase
VIPCTQPADIHPTTPSRFASTIVRDLAHAHTCRAAILGIPDDTGVRLNGGRPGAALAPRAIRAALATYGVAVPAGGMSFARVFDAGDVIPGDSLDETHDRVTRATEAILDLGLVPIALGGGHDLTFPFVRAACRRLGVRAGLYTDAHLDVRPEPGSGMPFRRLIEDCGINDLRIVGFRFFVNSPEHFDYFKARAGRVVKPASTIAQAAAHLPKSPAFVSIDLDAIDSSQAPGVSALNPSGLTVDQVASYAHAAGASPQVKCFDIMEHCPPHDEQGRTARVAAYILLRFLAGLSERPLTPSAPPAPTAPAALKP